MTLTFNQQARRAILASTVAFSCFLASPLMPAGLGKDAGSFGDASAREASSGGHHAGHHGGKHTGVAGKNHVTKTKAGHNKGGKHKSATSTSLDDDQFDDSSSDVGEIDDSGVDGTDDVGDDKGGL